MGCKMSSIILHLLSENQQGDSMLVSSHKDTYGVQSVIDNSTFAK